MYRFSIRAAAGMAVAGLGVVGMALAPTASAGGPSTAGYTCAAGSVSAQFVTSYPDMTVTLPIATGISFSSGSGSVTVWDSTSSSLVTYSGSKLSSNGSTIVLGPIPATSGTVSRGDLLHTSKTGRTTGISFTLPGGSTSSCTPTSDFSPPLTA